MRKHQLGAPLGLALAVATGAALAGSKPHEHGVVKLDVVIDGKQLTLALEAPLDNLLGFERAPRSDAERQAAAKVMAQLRAVGPLFVTDAAAQCTLSKATVQSDVLEPVARAAATPGSKNDGKPAPKATTPSEHADLDASYEFSCAQPQQLRSLDVGLFEAYKRIQRIDVQVAGPQGQLRATLKRPTRTIKLVR